MPRTSTIPTAVGIAAMAVTHASLGLVWTAVAEATCCGFWAYLAAFRPTPRLDDVCPPAPRKMLALPPSRT